MRILKPLSNPYIQLTPRSNLGLLPPLRTLFHRIGLRLSLLRIQSSLRTPRDAEVDLSLPSRNASQKHLLDILETLARCLREQEERVDRHGGAEDAKDEVDLPLDVDECGWDEVGERKVEDPVG
jgi:hypothetical protein